MAVPTDTLWERDPHTAAKHTLLRKYLSAWFPIMARQFREAGITFLDGFAGPGEYTNSSESSPVIAIDQARRTDVSGECSRISLVFIEDMKRRAVHLEGLVSSRYPVDSSPANVNVAIHHGNCGSVYEDAVAQAGGWNGPIFANLDGWGADTDYQLVRRIAKQQSSEVLVTFQDQFFIRFADGEQEAGERVFGNADWRKVNSKPSHDKKAFLLSLYRNRLLEAGFLHVLQFEMVDENKHSLHQFFGTTSEVAVRKFKDGLWEVDGVAGQRFRDPRDPDQLSVDISKPDFFPLRKEILAQLQDGEKTMEDLCLFALHQTIYREPHVKPIVDVLIEEQKVTKLQTGRSYKEQVLALAPPSLF